MRDTVEKGVTVVAVEMGDLTNGQILSDVEADANGADLATARIDRAPLFGFTLAPENLDFGADIWTFGFPLTGRPNEREPKFTLNGRYLEGYVMRSFYYGDPAVPTYELDMPAPQGVSGAPLIERKSTRVAGVVYGVHEVQAIEHFASIDPDTREKRPEVVRLESFSLAHYTETLWHLKGSATNGLELVEFLAV